MKKSLLIVSLLAVALACCGRTAEAIPVVAAHPVVIAPHVSSPAHAATPAPRVATPAPATRAPVTPARPVYVPPVIVAPTPKQEGELARKRHSNNSIYCERRQYRFGC